ncbi:hypothetical protein MYAER_2059 [Microcystis aeruginosa NIES-2549]|uniref:Uncharacterized protein n=1 Tax=Microcystis aeruginosa NIES-2549 TaxID=1641812 RepID=A0A0F6U3Y2_MICAE|nr:hypothetical protein MYAER_2059 [Microcystis aeruginosa NIES-2549]AOC52805.1 hypothetical protein amyaer_2086 [Microcystis aeruginosa NIES-2481]
MIISDKKPKLTIRAPRTNFIIKLVRYAIEKRILVVIAISCGWG